MKYAVTKTTVSYRAISADGDATANEVVFNGDVTGPMIWDAGIANMRAMTSAEIAAVPAQLKAARDAANPDLATLRDNATAAFNANATYLALASPSTAQNTAQIKALTQHEQQILKALAALALRVVPTS